MIHLLVDKQKETWVKLRNTSFDVVSGKGCFKNLWILEAKSTDGRRFLIDFGPDRKRLDGSLKAFRGLKDNSFVEYDPAGPAITRMPGGSCC